MGASELTYLEEVAIAVNQACNIPWKNIIGFCLVRAK